MTKTDAFIQLLEIGVSPEDAKELLDAVTRERKPIKPQERKPEPMRHTPVWALMDKPYGIVTGYKAMTASNMPDNFDFDDWQKKLR